MRDYAKINPQFWIGPTGKALRKAGPEAQIVALYLMTSPHANMLGLYWLPELYIQAETGLGAEGACKGLAGAISAGFCCYDPESEMVWVVQMAEYQIADRLEPSDKRCKGIQKEYDSLPDNPFLPAFFRRYSSAYNMTEARGLEGASKPHGSQEQEQEQEQEQKQEQKQDIRAHALPSGFSISDRVREWGAENKYSEKRISDNFAKFILYAQREGKKYKNWDAALMNAIRDDWAKVGEQKQDRHGGFAARDYHEGVTPDGKF